MEWQAAGGRSFLIGVLKSWLRQPRRAFNRSFGKVQAHGGLSVITDELSKGAVWAVIYPGGFHAGWRSRLARMCAMSSA